MKSRFLYAILTLTAAMVVATPLAAGAATAAETDAAPAPRAVVAEPVVDVGQVAKGEEVVHDFVVANEGDAPLEITEVRPACGCTVAEYDEVIPPGETGKIHAVLDTTDFAGGISKGLTVFTNDPRNPRLVLTMKAEVKPYLYVRPGFARFIHPQNSPPGTVEQLVFTGEFEDLQIHGARSPYPFVGVEYRPAREDERLEEGKGKQYVVTISMDYDAAPVGPLADYVRLDTNHPKQSELSIPVSGFVRPLVLVEPEAAEFGDVGEGDPDFGTIQLRSFAPKEMKVEVAETTVPGVDVTLEPVEEGRRFNVKVVLGPDVPRGPFEGVIRLKTDHPKKPVIEIPLRGNVL